MTYIIFVDKPKKMTSREVCDKIKSILNCKKVGHSGTLDANATGLLLIGIDNANKAMCLFENLDKEYEGVMYLHKDVDIEILNQIISKEFVGKITQLPPLKSRVARKLRKRMIYYFDIIEKKGKEVKFRTKVQAGTYIRKLVDDIGKRIKGAHLKELKRIRIGNFSLENAYTLKEVEEKKEKCFVKIEEAIDHIKKVYIKNSYLKKVLHGSPIFSDWIEKCDKEIKTKERIALMCGNKLVGIGVAKFDLDKNYKSAIIKTDRIISD